VFTRRRVAVFVDGCFWHCCPVHGRPPLSNGSYWRPKLARNVERDQLDSDRLKEAGWIVVRLWEHVPLETAVKVVERALIAWDESSGSSSDG
jgi:DNA mismatch endonuclease (patch repair protein)